MGTYRMGTDPKQSVVNTDLRAHDHANLFLLGSGVFPTGAASNPTLTIAALALRAVGAIQRAVACSPSGWPVVARLRPAAGGPKGPPLDRDSRISACAVCR